MHAARKLTVCATPTADKMHYLLVVVGLEQSIFPLREANHVLIEFDCDLFSLETQVGN